MTQNSEAVKRQFELFDKDKSGFIDRDELGRVLKSLDPKMWTESTIDNFLKVLDTNEDGVLQYSEVLSFVFDNTTPGEIPALLTPEDEAKVREEFAEQKNEPGGEIDATSEKCKPPEIIGGDGADAIKTTVVKADPSTKVIEQWCKFFDSVNQRWGVDTGMTQDKNILTMKRAFPVFSDHQTGKISFNKLKNVNSDVNGKLTDCELQEMLDGADQDGDGEVNEDEFISILRMG